MATEKAKGLRPFVVYGKDDRQDLYQVKDAQLRKLAASTMALVDTADLVHEKSARTVDYKLRTKVYGEEEGLCPDEKFRAQPTGAFCSGFLVGPDIVLTAGHCIHTEKDCRDTSFIFDFSFQQKNSSPEVVSENNVYSCAEIIHTISGKPKPDFAVIRLDRPVAGREPLELASAAPSASDTLVAIGHPMGLPTKVAGGGRLREVKENSFVADLDTFAGSSGSAVLSGESGRVVGILVSGETDHVFDASDGCNRVKKCEMSSCKGETSTLVSAAAEFIPLRRGKTRPAAPNLR